MKLLRVLWVVFFMSGAHALSLELLMVEQAGCPYCARFNQIIAPIYPKTEVGQRLPLRRIDLHEPALKALELRKTVRYTPTFLLIENNKETARFEGFISEDFFWGWLEKEAAHLK